MSSIIIDCNESMPIPLSLALDPSGDRATSEDNDEENRDENDLEEAKEGPIITNCDGSIPNPISADSAADPSPDITVRYVCIFIDK
jgi:hypothetical protein